MDLQLIPGAEPTPAERAAVDTVLGPPADGWDGGDAPARARRATPPRGGHASPRAAPPAAARALGAAGADRLDQPGRAERGLPPPDDPAGRRLRRRHASTRCFAVEPRPARVVHVCEDIACRCNGSDDLIAQLEERFGAEGELSDDGSATWYRSPCLGQCDRAPGGAASAMPATARTRSTSRADRPPPTCSTLLAGGGPGTAPDDRRCRRPASRRCGCCAGARAAARASTTTARPAATRRCAARSSSARRA